jgi:DNA-binding GntR family transcriptional regulator
MLQQTPVSPQRIRLAQQIVQMVQSRGWRRGHHLIEQVLVDNLAVSRSPVRGALRFLESRGIVEARRNQGFFLVSEGADLHKIDLEAPQTREEQLYLRLIEDRLAEDLPQSVTQAYLMQRYGAGRATLRRTLMRMADEGLVVPNPGQGWSFAPSLEGVPSRAASYAFRIMIEPTAILLPTFTIDSAVLDQICRDHVALLGQMEQGFVASAWSFEADARFHEVVAEFSHNPFVLNAIRQQNRLRRLLEFRSYGNQGRLASWCREHLEILAALKRGRCHEASRLMREHLETAMAVAVGGASR